MEQLNAKLLEYKWPILLSFVGIVLIIGGIFSSNLLPAKHQIPAKSYASPNPTTVKVDVEGAVVKPGVINLNSDARVEDAVAAAGGLTDQANVEYISKYLNLSQKVSDGSKVYLPFQGEQLSGSIGTTVLGAQSSQLVSINSASQSDLDNLPGIGPATAQKIITARPYQDLSDLINKKVISKTVFDKIKDSISL